MQKQSSSKNSFGVAASPFNPIKLMLGIILFFGLLLLVFCGLLSVANGLQLLILGAYSLVAALLLIFKTKKILKSFLQ